MANATEYRIGQRLLVSDWMDCTYLGTYKGEHRARVDAECHWERGCFDAWYSCKKRYITLTGKKVVAV